MRNEGEQDPKLYEVYDNYQTLNIDHIPEDHYAKLYSKRLSDEDKEKVTKMFDYFIGTKKYHNYSKDVRPHQNSAFRYMLQLKANTYMYINRDTMAVTNAEDPNAIEFIHFFLKG